MGAVIFIFVLSLILSFIFSGMEAGVFALSRLRIRNQMRSGNRRARALYGYLEHPENFLWTILVGNTVANLTAFSLGVLGLHHWLGEWPLAFWVSTAVSIVVFYALVELLPKMLFRMYPNRLCMFVSLPFGLVDALLRPLVAPMALFSRWLLHWSGGKRFTGHLFGNREELRMIMQESGVGLTTEERVMINRVLDLQNLTVRQITTPMHKVVSMRTDTPVREVLQLCREKKFIRLPVWSDEGGPRRTAGVLHVSTLLYEPQIDLESTAGDHMRPALFLDSGTRLEVALRQMQRRGHRLAVVLDKDQTELGILSLGDILRFMFGEVNL